MNIKISEESIGWDSPDGKTETEQKEKKTGEMEEQFESIDIDVMLWKSATGDNVKDINKKDDGLEQVKQRKHGIGQKQPSFVLVNESVFVFIYRKLKQNRGC